MSSIENNRFFQRNGISTFFQQAHEIYVEMTSPSNYKPEIKFPIASISCIIAGVTRARSGAGVCATMSAANAQKPV
jgi:hypothetical protein